MRIEDFDIDNMKFKKLVSVGTTKGFVLTTHVDSTHEQIPLALLPKILTQLRTRSWINPNHDPSKKPVSRVVFSEIRRLDDGHHGIYVKTEVFDEETMKKIKDGTLSGFSIEFTEG